MQRLFRVGKSIIAGLVLLAVSALVADRGGVLRLDDILSVGRQAEQARASQGSCVMPTTGTVSGLTLVNDINTCFAAILTANSGGTAPANGTGAAAMTGQLWLDTSTTPNGVRMFDGTSWNVISYQDSASHVWTPPVGGGTNTIASVAGTTDLWSLRQAYMTISGTNTITGLASASAVAGTVKVVRFTGVLTLTHNATSMILPTAANITTAVGDSMVVLALTSTNVAVVSYQRADGTPLSPTSVFTGAISFAGIITPTALSGTTNDWNPTGLSTANRIRASASSAAIVTGLTAVGTGGTLIVHNVGSFAITLSNADTGSSAANRFSFIRSATLQPNDSVTLIYDITTARWRVWQSLPLQTAPTTQYKTTGSAATYTPTNPGVAYHRIRMWAGGGGGGAQITNSGATGTASSFQVNATGTAWTVVGGTGGNTGATDVVGGVGGTGGTDGTTSGTGYTVTKILRMPGSQGGYSISTATATWQAASGVVFGIGQNASMQTNGAAQVAAPANSGTGGLGAFLSGTARGAGGGGGEYLELWVVGMTTATYTVGGGGAGGAAGTRAGGDGAAGGIIIEEFY